MSDLEDFFTRWSRRKREASEQAEAAEQAETSTPPPHDGAPEADRAVAALPPSKPEPPIDPVSLPPIESIAAGTDIRAFLREGVPAELARAALRRAWEVDPTIRDFVGLAENAWNFNAPGGVPGFGPLAPAADLRRLMAQMLGDDAKSEGVPAAASGDPIPDCDALVPPTGPAGETANLKPVSQSETQQDPKPDGENAAPQHPEHSDVTGIRPVRRTHGSALPE